MGIPWRSSRPRPAMPPKPPPGSSASSSSELPAVHTIDGALDPDAPLVQDPALRPGDPLAATNVLREHRIGWGDVDAATADLVVEHTYDFPMVTQFAIEPHAFMAAPDGDGIAIWSSIQHPYWLQRVVAKVLGLPLAKVRVYAPDPGGAFGGKQHAKFEPLVAFLALATGRPVRLVLSLEESFQAVRRASSSIRVRTGFLRDGTIAFQDIAADYLIGAYADIADRVVGKGTYPGCGPYRVPAARIFARSVLSHTTPSTAFRGFGAPQINWAVESNLDEGALQLGIDRLDLRLRNLARRGEAFIPFDTPADGDWEQSLRRAAEMIGWGTPLPDGRGRGIAVGIKSGPTTGLSHATVRVLADGSAVVSAGTSDMGQGARTIFAQIVTEELGIPAEWVTVHMGDTATVPVRPADLGESIDRAHGQRDPRRLPRCRREDRRNGRAAPRRRRRHDRGRRRVGAASGRPPPADGRGHAGGSRVRSVARSSGSGRPARRPTRRTRSGVPRRSSSSTPRPSRPAWTARPAT